MQFLNPLALIGLAAAVIPLALHLLHRGRPQAIPFSNLPFLRSLHQHRMRSVRLRQWLVLLVRTLALAALALAFARPALQTDGGDLFASARPRLALLLLDRSYSVTARVGSESVFDQLRRRALQVLDLFGPQDRIFLLPFDEDAGEAFSGSVERLRQSIEELSPGQGGTDVAGALTAAYRLLSDGEGRSLELYLLTDLARPGWQAPAGRPPAGLRTFVLPPVQRVAANRAIVGIDLEPWLITPGERFDLRVLLRSHGELPPEPPVVDLYVDGERVQRLRAPLHAAQDPQLAEGSASFSVAPRREGRLGAFAQIEGDALAADDRYYAVIDAPDSVRILLLGDRPTSIYYPRRALTAAAGGDPSLQLRTRLLGEADTGDWQWADVVILGNLERLADAQRDLLRGVVERGGGVILFPGPGADLRHLNRDVLPHLLPVSIGGVRGRPGSVGVRIDSSRLHSPLFAGLDRRHLPAAAASFELALDPAVEVLASFADERPALVEGHTAAGRVVLWSVPLDLTWSQWPQSGLFLPLLQRLSRHLALVGAAEGGYRVGDHAWRRLPGVDADARVQAQAPSGERRFVDTERAFGEIRWKVTDLDEAGIWRLLVDGEPQEAGIFAVNVDGAEADLQRLDTRRLRSILGDDALLLDPAAPLAPLVGQARVGRELWRELLLLAGVLLLLELWIARAPRSAPSPAAD